MPVKKNAAPNWCHSPAKVSFVCHSVEKDAWRRTAGKMRLEDWIRHILNQAAGRPDEPTDEERRQIYM
jgi:hypothetical protein